MHFQNLVLFLFLIAIILIYVGINKDNKKFLANISSYNELTNIEVVRLLLNALGKDESLISYVKDRKIHDYKYTMSSEKIRNELGWKPIYRLEDSIFDIIK